MPQIAETLIPVTTYVITTAKLGPGLGEAVGYRGAISDSDLADGHYRIVDDDRLMWSGRATTWPGNPRRYVRALRAEIGKTYPQLGKVAVEYAWSGTLGHPLHRMPQIGELGPGLWLASGFGGHGLNTTAMAGNLIARAIANDDPTWKLFTPFELVWAGGKYGRALAQVYYWTRRFSEALGERRAQLGEFGRRRAARQIGAVDVDRSAVGAPPPETVAEVTSSAEGGLPAGDTAPPPADVETVRMDMLAAAVEPEAMPDEDTPPPMALIAGNRENPQDEGA
jgi:hypothetical protein